MSFSFNICKIKAKHSGELLKSRQCIKRASAPSKGEKVKFFPSNTDAQSKAMQCPIDTPHPSPFSEAALGSEPPTARGMLKLHDKHPGDMGGQPPLIPSAPQPRLTPSEQLRGPSVGQPPVSQDGFAVTKHEGLRAATSSQHQPRPPSTIHHATPAPRSHHSVPQAQLPGGR